MGQSTRSDHGESASALDAVMPIRWPERVRACSSSFDPRCSSLAPVRTDRPSCDRRAALSLAPVPSPSLHHQQVPSPNLRRHAPFARSGLGLDRWSPSLFGVPLRPSGRPLNGPGRPWSTSPSSPSTTPDRTAHRRRWRRQRPPNSTGAPSLERGQLRVTQPAAGMLRDDPTAGSDRRVGGTWWR